MPNSRSIACSLLALSLAAGTSALAQPVLRVYDARDLASALPQGDAGAYVTVVPVLSNIPILNRYFVDRGSAADQANSANSVGSPTDIIVSRLCTQLHLESERLVEGVYLVKGETADQEQFAAVMEKTRSLYLGAYEVELICYVVPAASAPAIGAAPDSPAPLFRTRQTIARRVQTSINVTETVAFVQDWTPVVGNDSVGYDPQISQVDRGLSVTVLVGAGPDFKADGKSEAKGDGPVPFSIRGQISDAKIELFKAAQAQPPGTTLEIGLPSTSGRSISSEARLAQGKPTVLAVVPGFKAGEAIVIAASVREIK